MFGDTVDALRFLVDQAREYEQAISELLEGLVPLARWAFMPEHFRALRDTMQTVAGSQETGRVSIGELRHYPALVCLYAAGLAAVHQGNYPALKALAIDSQFRALHGVLPMVSGVRPWKEARLVGWVLDQQELMAVTAAQLAKLVLDPPEGSLSKHLFAYLRGLLGRAMSDDATYRETFDRLEILLAMVTADLGMDFDSYLGRLRADPYGQQVDEQIEGELRTQGSDWPPLAAGLFGRRVDRARAALVSVANEISRALSPRAGRTALDHSTHR